MQPGGHYRCYYHGTPSSLFSSLKFIERSGTWSSYEIQWLDIGHKANSPCDDHQGDVPHWLHIHIEPTVINTKCLFSIYFKRNLYSLILHEKFWEFAVTNNLYAWACNAAINPQTTTATSSFGGSSVRAQVHTVPTNVYNAIYQSIVKARRRKSGGISRNMSGRWSRGWGTGM